MMTMMIEILVADVDVDVVRATVRRCDHMTYDVRQVRRTTHDSTTWSHSLSKQLVSK